MKLYYLLCVLLCFCMLSCKKQTEVDESTLPHLIFRLRFDSTQARLNNMGQPSSVPAGHAAQSPVMNNIAVHYVELASDASTALGKGLILYKTPETIKGGDTAIDYDKLVLTGDNQVFFALPLKDVAAGNYEWLRISLAYQNYTIQLHIDTTINDSTVVDQDVSGTIASFIGYNTYISSYQIQAQSVTLNENRKQGYWGFETIINSTSYTTTGQSPEGATTVVNPIFDTSPIPAGSCVVTAAFNPGKLTITGNETGNIIVEVSLSTNKSFEWEEIVPNGKWDPLQGEKVVDMGIRGIMPVIQ
ncbi:MAG: hypothetical protein QM802_11325 [Agriterribacter sp.]